MIHFNNVGFTYRRRNMLFDNLNLTLKPGCVYGLLGRNGAGKTSLLRLMSGLLFAQKGNCTVNGHNPAKRSPDFLSEVFFIPEEFELPPVTIREYVNLNAGFYPKFDLAQFNHYIDEFELPDHWKMTELSHGQKKKAFACFALAANTSLLIMDEPTNGLDIPSKAQFRRLIAAAVSEDRVVVVSTHQVRDLDKLIDPVIILEKSEVLVHASMDEISERFSFGIVADTAGLEDQLLYSEPSVRGIATIMPANGQASSKPDLELLFNAALNKPDEVRRIMAVPLA